MYYNTHIFSIVCCEHCVQLFIQCKINNCTLKYGSLIPQLIYVVNAQENTRIHGYNINNKWEILYSK